MSIETWLDTFLLTLSVYPPILKSIGYTFIISANLRTSYHSGYSFSKSNKSNFVCVYLKLHANIIQTAF
jgi:hypothetical protein